MPAYKYVYNIYIHIILCIYIYIYIYMYIHVHMHVTSTYQISYRVVSYPIIYIYICDLKYISQKRSIYDIMIYDLPPATAIRPTGSSSPLPPPPKRPPSLVLSQVPTAVDHHPGFVWIPGYQAGEIVGFSLFAQGWSKGFLCKIHRKAWPLASGIGGADCCQFSEQSIHSSTDSSMAPKKQAALQTPLFGSVCGSDLGYNSLGGWGTLPQKQIPDHANTTSSRSQVCETKASKPNHQVAPTITF